MSTPEKISLAERMSLAAQRAAGERLARSGQPAAPAGAARGHSHGAWQVPARAGDHVTLMPGQMHFGSQAASLRTLLGSCLSVTLWHPERRIGGMCHFLLPSRSRKPGDPLDGRYGDEALEAMVQLLQATRTDPKDYHAHLYGGADTMPEGTALKFNVGERNIEQGFNLVDRYGFQIQGVDVGEDVPRTVTLTLATGEVDMRRGIGKAPPVHLPQHAAPQAAPRRF
jgi:chemotaxis protein CheD